MSLRIPFPPSFKPLSVTNSSIGSRTAAAGNVGAAIVAHLAGSVRSRTDVIICNWKVLYSHLLFVHCFCNDGCKNGFLLIPFILRKKEMIDTLTYYKSLWRETSGHLWAIFFGAGNFYMCFRATIKLYAKCYKYYLKHHNYRFNKNKPSGVKHMYVLNKCLTAVVCSCKPKYFWKKNYRSL